MAQEAATKQVPVVPMAVPGQGMAELVRHLPVFVKGVMTSTDTTSVLLIELPGNCIVVRTLVHVSTPFDASGTSAAATATVAMPFDTGSTTVWDAANVGLQTTGWKLDTGGPVMLASSGGFVTVAYTPGTTTTGQLEVYVEVLPLAERL